MVQASSSDGGGGGGDVARIGKLSEGCVSAVVQGGSSGSGGGGSGDFDEFEEFAIEYVASGSFGLTVGVSGECEWTMLSISPD